jgi:hypothetical protein
MRLPTITAERLNRQCKLRTFSFWSLLTGAATFATILLVIPEARAALKQVGHR